MSLNKEQLKQGIIRLQQDMQRKTDASMEEYAERLASLIDTFVKSGEVTVESPYRQGLIRVQQQLKEKVQLAKKTKNDDNT